MAVPYRLPQNFLSFRLTEELFRALVDAKAGVEALRGLPYQKSWMEPLRELELKNEVAGTSMIEGATFAGEELEAAFGQETLREAATRSQKQVISAKNAYRWIEQAPPDLPVERVILEIHRLMVTGCDDDHCAPGVLRGEAQEVSFGSPPQGGAWGGKENREAFDALVAAANTYFGKSDPLLQALAIHYHLGAAHPFQDGNGRTARGVEAFFLRRAGFATHGFIGLSNYYHGERRRYLQVLAETRQAGEDLTAFFVFGQKGIVQQCARIRNVILKENKIVLFKNMMHRVYNKHRTKKRRYLNDRQVYILEFLLDQPGQQIGAEKILSQFWLVYGTLKNKGAAMGRDIKGLVDLGAVDFVLPTRGFFINLDWPQTMTESDFGQAVLDKPPRKDFPKFTLV